MDINTQAKGRVERAFQTLQDRWVKALRLAGCSSLEQANALLPSLVQQYNARFARKPLQTYDAHRPWRMSAEHLAWTCSEQYSRSLSKSLSCQFRGELLQVQTGAKAGYELRAAKVVLCVDPIDPAKLTMLHANKPLAFKRFRRQELASRLADDKTINIRIEQLRRQPPKPYVPPPKHPWRRSFKPQCAEA
jgi:hypothetical protein